MCYPLEQIVSVRYSCFMLSTLVSPFIGLYKTSLVECAVLDHTYWREAPQSGKPVRGGTGFDTLLRVPHVSPFQTIVDCDKPVVPSPRGSYAISLSGAIWKSD